jgi:hypothetical protein
MPSEGVEGVFARSGSNLLYFELRRYSETDGAQLVR